MFEEESTHPGAKATTKLERTQVRSYRQHSNLASCSAEPPATGALDPDGSATTVGLVNKSESGTDEEITADPLDLS